MSGIISFTLTSLFAGVCPSVKLQEFINTDSSNMMEHDFVNKRNIDLSVI
jgi:hypothetical protein